MIINNDFETKLVKLNFFCEEVRDGYYISSEMKKIWAVQLDILRELIYVCAKNNIEYFLEGGTLLGAVRHGGYIPWDDDIDICMTREQYNKLLLCGEKEFKYPYLFQSPLDSTSYNRNHVQIRNITTTAILKKEYKRFDFNQGIFIDIFVLDQCPKDRSVLGKYMWFQLRYNLFRRLKYNMFYDNHKFLQFLAKWVSYAIPYKVVNPQVYEQKSGQYYGTKANSWMDFYCFSEGKYKKLRYFEPDWFEGYTIMKFEMLTVKVPCQYDNILRQMYGNNYKIPIHKDTYHGEILFDVNTAFEDYILDE